jgi:DNA-directed RNA polymerase specialized sigma24 family protein
MDDLRAGAFCDDYGEVNRFACRRTDSDDEPEEITQSVFMEVAARLDPVKRGSVPLFARRYTVAQRLLFDAARIRTREEAALRFAEAHAAEAGYGLDVSGTLPAALTKVPGPQRDVVVLRPLEGQRFAKFVVQLDSPEAPCKMLFLRGLSPVRDAFGSDGITQ